MSSVDVVSVLIANISMEAENYERKLFMQISYLEETLCIVCRNFREQDVGCNLESELRCAMDSLRRSVEAVQRVNRYTQEAASKMRN